MTETDNIEGSVEHYNKMKKALEALGMNIDDYNWGYAGWNKNIKESYRNLMEDLAEKWNQVTN